MIWDILQQTSFNDYFTTYSIPTLTPQKLLLDENIITEFKNLNPQLIQYVQNNYDEFLSRLIEYTIKMPLQSDSQDRVRKLPYVSSQVLAIDNQTIYKAFFDCKKDYFAQLAELFNTEAKNNQILSGYFVKILQNLYKSQKKKTALKIQTFRQIFFQNLDKQSVSTVFTLFLVLLQTQQGFMLNQRKQVIQKLIQNLVTGDELIKNVCKNVLNEVIAKFQTFSSGDELLTEILNSNTLIKVFQIQDSKAVDEFLIGYMTKALQKICTSGEQKKSLFEIPQNHRDGIKTYIISKKNILQNYQSPNSGFKNQSRTEVYRLDKKVITLLSLMKLALQNSIIGFQAQEDILALFSILSAHPSNDIIKVKIFDIFTLIYTKKDTQAQQFFGKYFFQRAIELFKKDKKMYGHFLYQLCKVIGKKKLPKEFMQEKNQQEWAQLMKYFDLLDNYEKEAQKVVERYSNLTKVTKLVVDEEDKASIVTEKSSLSQQISNKKEDNRNNQIKIFENKDKEDTTQVLKQNSTQKTQTKQTKNSIDAFSFDFFDSKVSTQTKTSNSTQTKSKVDPFAAFDFFGPKNAESTEDKPTEVKNQEKKKADFNDFASFF